jgi:hypothetical protein
LEGDVPLNSPTEEEMMSREDLDRLRGAALERIERNPKPIFLAGAGVEAAFLVAFVALADFGNRSHVPLLLSIVALYTILVLGLFALGAHVSRCSERVLRVMDVSRPPVHAGETP